MLWARTRQRLGGPLQRRVVVVLLAVVAAAGIAWGAVSAVDVDLTALSIAVAVLFGAVSSYQNSSLQRRQHTVSVLASFSTAETLAASDAVVARLLANGTPITDSIPAEQDRHLINLLDFYEFVSRLSLVGALDTKLVLALRGSTIDRTWRLAQPYITARRTATGAVLYDAMEEFVNRYQLVVVPAPRGADRRPVDRPL